MKTKHIVSAVAALFALMMVFIVALFSQQSSMEEQLSALRVEVERSNGTVGKTVFVPSNEGTVAVDTSRVGRPEPVGNDELLDAARARISELENVLNGQADVLERLLAEANQREEARRKASMRSWGEEQATGAPDTLTPGDHNTAWAPAVADGGVEWLEAEFENAADLAKIVVRQTSNPGGVTKVVAIGDNGAEIPIWAGEDPSKGQQLADTPFAVNGAINAKRVRVYVDTRKMPGWEEIDAVQITGRDGASQWAKSSKASSTYASGRTRFLGGYRTGLGEPDLFIQNTDEFQIRGDQ